MESQREIFLNLYYTVKIIFTLPFVMLVYFKQSEERPVLQKTWTKLMTSYLSSCREVTKGILI